MILKSPDLISDIAVYYCLSDNELLFIAEELLA